jgi:hypothetical protein
LILEVKLSIKVSDDRCVSNTIGDHGVVQTCLHGPLISILILEVKLSIKVSDDRCVSNNIGDHGVVQTSLHGPEKLTCSFQSLRFNLLLLSYSLVCSFQGTNVVVFDLLFRLFSKSFFVATVSAATLLIYHIRLYRIKLFLESFFSSLFLADSIFWGER